VRDFLRLNRRIRACALVGSFLEVWSLMEGSLDSLLGTALSLNVTTETILCKTIQLRDKINILRRLVYLSSLVDTEKTKVYDILREIETCAEAYRNKMVHNPFWPSSTNDGVVFRVIRARGSLKHGPLDLHDLDLSVDEFGGLYQKVVNFSNELEELEGNLQASRGAVKE